MILQHRWKKLSNSNPSFLIAASEKTLYETEEESSSEAINKLDAPSKSDLEIIGMEDPRIRHQNQRQSNDQDDDTVDPVHKSGNSSSTDSNNGNSNNDSSPCTSDTG